ncbi:MAG: tRNA (adenosine(37)-N6)-threonylcarbamoyltransferase complex transferase subunit TsaD [Parcubacteria group bacterium]|nr:MAG: tRNA (adenosine(37)-N6)-threonylcarbamoyltransferase complex transferase subunit TsaD [Parcubacteria group bacterium]
MKILAIETSCDETAIALLEGRTGLLKLEQNLIYSQIAIHQKYGGVVPELAARKHAETIVPLLSEALGKDRLKKVDYLAVTAGPGLITSLLSGITMAKTLAYVNNKPLCGINHIEGHIYSNWLSNKELVRAPKKYFPALILIVSGGHTELVFMRGHGRYQLLGQTLDDAAGECFDKVAKLLSLGYPGGPIISQLAAKGNSRAYYFPRPMISSRDYNFSFAGLKTAVLYTLEKKRKIYRKDLADLCASFQQAVIEVLVAKTIKASQVYKVKAVLVGGGVAANKHLLASLQQACQKEKKPFFYPQIRSTGDNAAMIAVAAYYGLVSKRARVLKGREVFGIKPNPNWQLTKNKL